MRKKTTRSNYRPPNRSEKILAVIGLLVVGSLLFTALAPSFTLNVQPPTQALINVTVLVVDTPTATSTSTATSTPTATSGTPATATPGQAPPPAATP